MCFTAVMALLEQIVGALPPPPLPETTEGTRRCARLIMTYARIRRYGRSRHEAGDRGDVQVRIPVGCRSNLKELEGELNDLDDSDVAEGLRWRCLGTTCSKE